MKTKSDTKIIGTKPIEQLMEEAWEAINSESKASAPPEGPGWKSDRQIAKERGIHYCNVSKSMRQSVERGDVEIYEQHDRAKGNRMTVVRWYRPIVKRSGKTGHQLGAKNK